MRVNRPWKPDKWLPVFTAMPRMLDELRRQPDLGLLAANTYLSGLTVLLVQYWENPADLAPTTIGS